MKTFKQVITSFLVALLLFTGYIATPSFAIAEETTRRPNVLYQSPQGTASESEELRFVRERIPVSQAPDFYVPEDLDETDETASLFSFKDASGDFHFRVHGRYGNNSGFFASDETGEIVDVETGPIPEEEDRERLPSETEDLEESDIGEVTTSESALEVQEESDLNNIVVESETSTIEADSISNAEPEAQLTDVVPELDDESKDEMGASDKGDSPDDEGISESTLAQRVSPVACITMEEFEKLLALQSEPSEEYVESCMIRTEDADGNGTLEAYFAPVRYKDSDGEWKMIDPTIRAVEKSDNRVFESSRSSTHILFYSADENKQLISLEQDGYAIQLTPITQEGNTASKAYEMDFLSDTDNLVSRDAGDHTPTKDEYASIRYRDAYAGNVDLVFTPTGNGLKEEIVFYRIPEQADFSFLLSLKGLLPLLRADKYTFLFASGKTTSNFLSATLRLFDIATNSLVFGASKLKSSTTKIAFA